MPKFIKLKLNGLPKSDSDAIQWRLVIDNEKDLNEYHGFNATQNMEAFMSMERDKGGNIMLSHTGPAPTRAIVLQRLLHAKINTTPEGQKFHPIFEVAEITDKKHLAMLRFLKTSGAIQMNEAGGYCGLSDFIQTWDAEVLETIEKDNFGFPTNEAAINADTIILENSHRDYIGGYFEKRIKRELPNCGTVKTIYNIREVDTSYVFKCLSNCKNVATETQLQDDSQLNSFMQLFTKLKNKNIYLYVLEDVENRIKAHNLFATNSALHIIKFINK